MQSIVEHKYLTNGKFLPDDMCHYHNMQDNIVKLLIYFCAVLFRMSDDCNPDEAKLFIQQINSNVTEPCYDWVAHKKINNNKKAHV
jgi:hypothetical protein